MDKESIQEKMRRLGQIKSEKKSEQSRINGRAPVREGSNLRGRPRKVKEGSNE